MPDHAFIAKFKFLLICALAITVVANGVFFWLSKSQFINIDHINDTIYISDADYQHLSLNEKQHLVEKYKSLFYFFEYDENHTYHSNFESLINQYQSVLKLLKDVFIGLLIIFLFAYLIKTRRYGTNFYKTGLIVYSWHVWLIVALFMISIYLSIQNFTSLIIMLSGFRSLYFLVISLLLIAIQRLDSDNLMKILAYAFLVIVIIQFPFVIIEYRSGTEIFNGSSLLSAQHDRVAGTFNQPSSLAIFMVLSLVLWWEAFTIRISRYIFYPFMILVLFYILSAASSMAILLFIFFSIYLLSQSIVNGLHIRLRKKHLFMIAIILSLFLTISHVSISYVREDYLDSLWFRVDKFYQYFQSISLTTLLFGQGLGSGTNTAYQFATQVSSQISNLAHIDNSFDYKSGLFITDSMILTLMSQTGIIATFLIYACLTYGAIFITRYRISFMMTIIASFSTNINELFPLYLLLSLLLYISYVHFTEPI